MLPFALLHTFYTLFNIQTTLPYIIDQCHGQRIHESACFDEYMFFFFN